jgi:hypothetical protein
MAMRHLSGPVQPMRKTGLHGRPRRVFRTNNVCLGRKKDSMHHNDPCLLVKKKKRLIIILTI